MFLSFKSTSYKCSSQFPTNPLLKIIELYKSCSHKNFHHSKDILLMWRKSLRLQNIPFWENTKFGIKKKKISCSNLYFHFCICILYFPIFYRYTLAQILGQRMRAVTDCLSYTIIWRSEGSVLCFLWHINVYICFFCICIIYMDHWFWYSDANRCIIITILLSVCIMIIPCNDYASSVITIIITTIPCSAR